MRSSILHFPSSTLLLIGALLLPAGPVTAQVTKLRASFAGTTGYHLPMWVQKQEGLDKKYGLDMEILLIAGGSGREGMAQVLEAKPAQLGLCE